MNHSDIIGEWEITRNIEDKLNQSLSTMTNQLQEKEFNTLMSLIISSFIILFFVAVISFYIIKELNQQVVDLTCVMSTVSDENDLTARAKYTSKSELGQISIALNSTLEKFSVAMKGISTSSTTLAAAA